MEFKVGDKVRVKCIFDDPVNNNDLDQHIGKITKIIAILSTRYPYETDIPARDDEGHVAFMEEELEFVLPDINSIKSIEDIYHYLEGIIKCRNLSLNQGML